MSYLCYAAEVQDKYYWWCGAGHTALIWVAKKEAWRAAKLMNNGRDKVNQENGNCSASLCAISKSLNNCSFFPRILGLNSYCPSNNVQFLQLSAFMEVWQLFLSTLVTNILAIQSGRWHWGALTQQALMRLHWYMAAHTLLDFLSAICSF